MPACHCEKEGRGCQAVCEQQAKGRRVKAR
uniref:Uncharacterized protein n=1 Tax=Arundo donax TaxID=35708 RepID=A0A0A9FYD2_ARUDO